MEKNLINIFYELKATMKWILKAREDEITKYSLFHKENDFIAYHTKECLDKLTLLIKSYNTEKVEE